MALVSHAKREINAKIVYCGPALSGKATNLKYIYKKLKPAFRGTIKVMNVQQDRMLFFDFMPTGQRQINGYNVRLHLYTLMGTVSAPSSWKAVLKGVDGVVFVADSGADRMAANAESFATLHEHLGSYGVDASDIPCIIQCNKRDMASALPLEELERSLNPGPIPLVPAVAGHGEGVLETLFTLVKMVLKNLRESGDELGSEREPLPPCEEVSVAGNAEPDKPSQSVFETETAGTPASVPVEERAVHHHPEPSGAVAGSGRDEPVIELRGGPEVLSGGVIRLPLYVRHAGLEKKVAIHIALSLEAE